MTKGGVKLPVLRCAHGTTSLESFHLYLRKFTPSVFSGEHIGVEYLGTQSDTLAEKEPEREFDGAFKNYESAKTDVVEDTKVQDLTLSLSEDSLDSDSGTEGETEEQDKEVVDSKALPGAGWINWLKPLSTWRDYLLPMPKLK